MPAQNLPKNEPEKPDKALSPHSAKTSASTGKAGLTHNILEKMGQGGALAGNVAGNTFQTLANAVGSTGQMAGLVLAGKLQRGEVPNFDLAELAGQFEAWLAKQNRGEVVTSKVTVEGLPVYRVTFKERGFLSGTYLFIFAGTNSPALDAYIKAEKAGAKDFSGVALVLQEWDSHRFSLEKEWSYFVWCGGVRMGKGGPAADYLSSWLVNLTGRQFEKCELLEGAPQDRAPARLDATFTGRGEILDVISRSVLTTDLAGQGLPWLFSLSSVGGAGKSYLLNIIRRIYAPRLLSVKLDHLDYAEAGNDLLDLLGLMAARFRQAGCPTPNFEKLYRQVTQSTEEAEKKQKKIDFARQVGQVISGATARKIALQLSKTFDKFWFVKHVPGIIGVSASLIEVGVSLFGQLTREQQDEIDTLLGSQPVQDLTQALIQDIARFVNRQKEKYYLWRRPLLVFDTYEQAGPVIDQWLRTVLLANPAFRVLEPVVMVAGRFELLTYDSRWSEFQGSLRSFRLLPFSFNETAEYLYKLGITDPGRVANLYELTGGLPLFLHLAANLNSEATIIKVLAERLLEEVDPDWRAGFLEMAVPDGFNLDTVRKYTNPKSQAEPFFDALRAASFAEYRGGLWHFLGPVRQIFLRYREMKGHP